jgi:dTMP kinase
MIIAIEGCDAAGKKTQAERLTQHFRDLDYEAESLAFPVYSSYTGKRITELLQQPEVNSLDLQSLMTINRYEAADQLRDAKSDKTKFLVLDRYYASGIAYGEADGLDGKWLRQIHRSLPRPDLWVYLDVSVEESFRRRPVREDAYEASKERLAAALRAYSDFFAHEERSNRLGRPGALASPTSSTEVLRIDTNRLDVNQVSSAIKVGVRNFLLSEVQE